MDPAEAMALPFSRAECFINPMALDDEILTVKEVSELLRVNQSTVYKLIRQGRMPAFRIGSDWRIRTDLIARWMAGDGPQ